MTLDPYLAARLHLLAGLGDRDGLRTDPEALSRFAEYQRDPAEWLLPDVSVEDRTVPGPHGEVPVRIYRPRETDGRALMWLHGGGFVHGDLDMPEAHTVSAELAVRARALVVSVDYRLAVGGVRYPVPVDDAYAAWTWLAETGWVEEGAAAIGGASAGSALALSTALRLRDRGRPLPRAVLLAYPFLHFPNPALDGDSAARMDSLPPLLRFTPESIEGMVRNYVGRVGGLPSDAMPGAADLTGLPATSFVLSEYDDLRPSGELLARQLEEAGVPHRTFVAAGMTHGHLNRGPSLGEVDRSLDFFAAALKD
ncbi:alpha/beta hydrolase fold domain-containing protein [Nocardiopsis sp. CT-R113]|uniref:Alpha/beta hydrolase fold domain-containing protein n=1 Tax=Nocardiopsis codii TaxID=3065942 RepID=A0ABU7KAM5_9ACTN|nr:alpha/beta hydrolase fold domain-containing protein [Nocardiopsis sp. CT-R113]MEE2039285.1 alpha/beta hydrolase fold domain-containing protein [Nocardiopsis sp. CT-R113]